MPRGKLGVLFAVLRADCVKSFQWLSRLKILPKTQNMLYSAGSSELCQNAKKMWNNRNNITCCGRHITVAAATYVVQTGLKSCQHTQYEFSNAYLYTQSQCGDWHLHLGQAIFSRIFFLCKLSIGKLFFMTYLQRTKSQFSIFALVQHSTLAIFF